MNEVFLTKLQQQNCTQAANCQPVKIKKFTISKKKKYFFRTSKLAVSHHLCSVLTP